MGKEKFEPKVTTVQGGPAKASAIGNEVEIVPSTYNSETNTFDATGEKSYKATLVGVGTTYGTVCLSRNAENCPKCNFPPEFCKAPIK
jgi:hypothetical protein